MGIELDVLVGHPEHDLLFIVSQVARNAGLADPSNAVSGFASTRRCTVKMPIGSIMSLDNFQGAVPLAPNGRRYHDITTLMDEPNVYAMLLRGNSPKSEPFRKWVTEEVLPTIRKTGKYDAESSANPIAMGLMDELKALRGHRG